MTGAINLNSSQILSRLQCGRAVELAALFERNREHLRHMIRIQLGEHLQSRLDSSDIIQETFLRASEGLEAYLAKPTTHPVVWIRLLGKQIASEAARFHCRQKRSPSREQLWEHESQGPLTERIADSVSSICTHVEKVETIGQLRSALAELPDIDREIIEMRHLEEMTILEIASALDLNSEAAKKRYYRALKRLRTQAGLS